MGPGEEIKLFGDPARCKHVVRAPAHLLSGIATWPQVRPRAALPTARERHSMLCPHMTYSMNSVYAKIEEAGKYALMLKKARNGSR